MYYTKICSLWIEKTPQETPKISYYSLSGKHINANAIIVITRPKIDHIDGISWKKIHPNIIADDGSPPAPKMATFPASA